MAANHAQRGSESITYRMLIESNIFQGHPPVLTHNDLRELNILVDKEGSFLTVYVIDWEYSAWCPSYGNVMRLLGQCMEIIGSKNLHRTRALLA